MAVKIQIRRDTSTNWATVNPILAQGEVGVELDTKKTKIGDGIKTWNQLDYWVSPITSTDVVNALGYTPYDSSNPAGYTNNVGTVTSVNNVSPIDGNVTIEIPDTATWGNITGTLSNQTDLNTALGNKVDKTTTANKVYGTDANGDQTTYDKNSFGQVDDVTVGGTSVVANKVAVLGSMAGETATDYATSAQGALADSAVQSVNNISAVNGNVSITIDNVAPSQSGQSGKFLTTNGTAISWGDAPVTDVQINSTSILSGGVANIPVAGNTSYGVVKVFSAYGAALVNGTIAIQKASDEVVSQKINAYQPIVPASLDVAIREGLGNNSLTWTDAYKSNARNTIGATQAVFVDWSE